MPGYLLIESRDPFESTGAARTCELAIQLRAAGHDVALFLVQNGVLAVRSGARRAELDKVIGTKIEVLADDFSLRTASTPFCTRNSATSWPAARNCRASSHVRAAPVDSNGSRDSISR